jgi:hypothetical protein
MKHRNNHFAVGYWSRIRQGRPAPDQADIDPKALKRLLPFVFLLDARPDGSFLYRLAGTTLCERYGGELRGRDFLSHWDDESRARLAQLLPQALAARMPVCLTSVGATSDCRMIEIETVLMPLTFGGGAPERFLCIAQVLTDVTTLQGHAIAFERLVASALVREEENSTSEALPPAPPPQGGVRARAPYLRLVASRPSPERPRALRPDPLRFDAHETLRKIFAFCGTARTP